MKKGKKYTAMLTLLKGNKLSKTGKRLLVGFLSFSLIPILLIGYFSYYQSSRIITNKVSQVSKQLVQEIGVNEDTKFKNIEDQSVSIANNQDVQSFLSNTYSAEDEFKRVQDLNKVEKFTNEQILSDSDIAGITIYTNDSSKTDTTILDARSVENTAWYRQIMDAKGAPIWLTTTGKTHNPNIYGNEPVYALGRVINNAISLKPLGILLIDMKEVPLSQQLNKMKLGDTGSISIIDSKGQFVSSPNKKLLGNPSKNEAYINDILKLPFKDEVPVNVTENINGQPDLITAVKLSDTGWILYSAEPLAELMQDTSKIAYATIAIAIVCLILASIIAVIIAKRLSDPIRKLMDSMNQVATGDLRVAAVEVRTRDEIGQLAQAFNQMTDNLRNLIKHVEISSEHVAAAAEELLASSEQTSQASHHIASSVQEVFTGSQEQASYVENSTNTIVGMASGIQRISNDSETMLHTSGQAYEATIEGNQAVEKIIHQMQFISDNVQNASNSINKLSEHTQHIGKIVEFISNIASQTNLLALNAAIEAARAGEHGRGFAVVANEVRKLAEDSSNSAKKIAEYTKTIYEGIAKVIKLMEVGKAEVVNGIEVVKLAKESFDKIEYSVDQVSQKVVEVSHDTKKMSGETKQIVEIMRHISGISERAVSATETISAATEEQLASMEEIAHSSNTLTKMTEELRSLINEFKL